MRNIDMKKHYEKPEMNTMDMEHVADLLSASGNGNSGWAHENACEHGSHAHFCDD